MVLTISMGLIVFGAVVFFILEYSNEAFVGLSFAEKIWASLFQSVTARTAGFNTIDLSAMSEPGKFVMIGLMFVCAGAAMIIINIIVSLITKLVAKIKAKRAA